MHLQISSAHLKINNIIRAIFELQLYLGYCSMFYVDCAVSVCASLHVKVEND